MMKLADLPVVVGCTIPLLAVPLLIAADGEFSTLEVEGLRTFVEHSFSNKAAGMVVGLVDKNGTKIIAYGKLDNGTDKEVNGDTVFVIGSITKTFTVLLLQDMVERGEMKLADPVAKYLPPSVKIPTRGRRLITVT